MFSCSSRVAFAHCAAPQSTCSAAEAPLVESPERRSEVLVPSCHALATSVAPTGASLTPSVVAVSAFSE